MPQAAESSLLKVECQVELSSYILTLFESALRIWLVWVTGSPGDQLRSHWQETANSLPGWQQLDWSCLCLLPVFCPAASLLKLEARTSPLIWQSVGDSSNLNSSSSSYPINHDEYEINEMQACCSCCQQCQGTSNNSNANGAISQFPQNPQPAPKAIWWYRHQVILASFCTTCNETKWISLGLETCCPTQICGP